jgi:NAD dependent epimerase/dehydratase family enzyme
MLQNQKNRHHEKKCFNNRRFWLRGKQLTQVLIDNGLYRFILSRDKRADAVDIFLYLEYTNSDYREDAVLKADYVIHLAGANIAEKVD